MVDFFGGYHFTQNCFKSHGGGENSAAMTFNGLFAVKKNRNSFLNQSMRACECE